MKKVQSFLLAAALFVAIGLLATVECSGLGGENVPRETVCLSIDQDVQFDVFTNVSTSEPVEIIRSSDLPESSTEKEVFGLSDAEALRSGQYSVKVTYRNLDLRWRSNYISKRTYFPDILRSNIVHQSILLT